MESGGHKSGSGAVHGAGAEGGLVCHACGYQYPNAHPSAKHRRAHRKHCGKLAAAAAAEEGEGRVLFSSEHSSHDVAGAQVIVDKCVEDHSDVASGITTGTNRTDNGDNLNVAAMEYPEKASVPEETVQSPPASVVNSEQLQDVSVPVLPPEPGYVSPELPVSEMQNSNAVPVASDAMGGDISEQTVDVNTEPNGTTVTGVDGVANSTGNGIPIEEKSVPASAVSSEQLQDVSVPVLPTEPGYVSPELPVMQNSNTVPIASDATGGEISEQTNVVITDPNGTTVAGLDGAPNVVGRDIPVEDKSVGDNLDSSCQETQQTKVGDGYSNSAVGEDSSDKNLSASQIEEIPNDKSDSNQQVSPILTCATEVVPNTEDDEPVNSDTQARVYTDDFNSEVADSVKPQEQPDSTSVAEDHYPNKDVGIKMISSAIEPAVNAEVISVDDADNMKNNVSSSDVTMGDTIQEQMTSNIVVPSQADLVDASTSSAAPEIDVVNNTNDLEEKEQNEVSVADLTAHDITDLVEEKQDEKMSQASSCNIPSTDSIEEEKQIKEVITNPASEKTIVKSDRDGVEENKQIEVDAKTNRDIRVVCTAGAIEEKDTSSEINAETITDDVEDKKQSEEVSAGNISDGTSTIYTTIDEEKIHSEDMTEDPRSHEKIVVHNTDNLEEREYEETPVDPTSRSTGMVTTTDSVEETKNAPHSTENVEEKEGREPISEPVPSKAVTVGSVGDDEEKKQNEETIADQISGENSTPQSTFDTEKDIPNKEAATVLVSDNSEVAKKTDAVEGTEQNNDGTAKEISTVQSMDDVKGDGQNEEIADKEVIVDSDRSHVSLKVLLADKNVENKEKKPSTKDRVLSFRRRSSKDNESPAKPGSPKADSGQQDWNSPARLPAEKKSKGKKQQWVPFICCPSIH